MQAPARLGSGLLRVKPGASIAGSDAPGHIRLGQEFSKLADIQAAHDAGKHFFAAADCLTRKEPVDAFCSGPAFGHGAHKLFYGFDRRTGGEHLFDGRLASVWIGFEPAECRLQSNPLRFYRAEVARSDQYRVKPASQSVDRDVISQLDAELELD